MNDKEKNSPEPEVSERVIPMQTQLKPVGKMMINESIACMEAKDIISTLLCLLPLLPQDMGRLQVPRLFDFVPSKCDFGVSNATYADSAGRHVHFHDSCHHDGTSQNFSLPLPRV